VNVPTYASKFCVPLKRKLILKLDNLPEYHETSLWKLKQKDDPKSELGSGTMITGTGIIEIEPVELAETELIVDMYFCSGAACFKKTLRFLLLARESETCTDLTYDCKETN